MSWLTSAWNFLKWAVGIEQAAEPIVKQVVDKISESHDEPGTSLPFTLVKDRERQIAEGTSHKVKK